MDDSIRNHHYLRDQYLELLWTAQKVEDRRLTELILQRLKDTAIEMAVAPAPACEIIPFPNMLAHPVGFADGHEELRLLWPRQPLRHLLSMVCGYCGIVLFFGWFGITS